MNGVPQPGTKIVDDHSGRSRGTQSCQERKGKTSPLDDNGMSIAEQRSSLYENRTASIETWQASPIPEGVARHTFSTSTPIFFVNACERDSEGKSDIVLC